MDNMSDNLMLSGVTAVCADCGDERIFVPVEGDSRDIRGDISRGSGRDSEFCCTSCDAAMFLFVSLDNTAERRAVA